RSGTTNQEAGFLLSGGAYSFIGFFNGSNAVASGINNLSQIVGYQRGWSFLINGGNLTFFTVPGAANGTFASGLNDAGRIVGTYLDAREISHGFLLTGGSTTTVDVPGAIRTGAS